MTHLDNWHAIVTTLRNKYQSETRIRNIEDELENLRLTDYEQSSVSEAQTLQKLAKNIETLVPQCPLGRYDEKTFFAQ